MMRTEQHTVHITRFEGWLDRTGPTSPQRGFAVSLPGHQGAIYLNWRGSHPDESQVIRLLFGGGDVPDGRKRRVWWPNRWTCQIWTDWQVQADEAVIAAVRRIESERAVLTRKEGR